MWRPSRVQPLLTPGKRLVNLCVLGFGSWLCENGKVTTDLVGRTLDIHTCAHARVHLTKVQIHPFSVP